MFKHHNHRSEVPNFTLFPMCDICFGRISEVLKLASNIYLDIATYTKLPVTIGRKSQTNCQKIQFDFESIGYAI